MSTDFEIHDQLAAMQFLLEHVKSEQQSDVAAIANKILGQAEQVTVTVKEKKITLTRSDTSGMQRILASVLQIAKPPQETGEFQRICTALVIPRIKAAQTMEDVNKILAELHVEHLLTESTSRQILETLVKKDFDVGQLLQLAAIASQWVEKFSALSTSDAVKELTTSVWKKVGKELRRLDKTVGQGALVSEEEAVREIALVSSQYKLIPPLFMQSERRQKVDCALIGMYVRVVPLTTREEITAAEKLLELYESPPEKLTKSLEELRQKITVAKQTFEPTVRTETASERQQRTASKVHESSMYGNVARALGMVGAGSLIVGLSLVNPELAPFAQQVMTYGLCTDMTAIVYEQLPVAWQQSAVVRESVVPIVSAVTSAIASGGPQSAEVKELVRWSLKYVAGPGVLKSLVAQTEKGVKKLTGSGVASMITGALLYGIAIDRWNAGVDRGVEAWRPGPKPLSMAPICLPKEPPKVPKESQEPVCLPEEAPPCLPEEAPPTEPSPAQVSTQQMQATAEEVNKVSSSMFTFKNVGMVLGVGAVGIGALTGNIVTLAAGGIGMIMLHRFR